MFLSFTQAPYRNYNNSDKIKLEISQSKPPFQNKAASYGYGYHLFLFLLYVIQRYNDYCYDCLRP